ncbi:GGDEF domain-containing protein [Motilimonas pumila]|uniref:diguanylate cyclase n=1 Tax=Motilimonas pumila TaxID=2303987 RepID=A0A418YIH8_9GAMM|nr:GGDEF domain-containing protein [Motilimonas pumila]RJG50456.1 GGDEF domain-containing protein [Motilimonas pumila]
MQPKSVIIILLSLISLTFIALLAFHQGVYKKHVVNLNDPALIEIVTDASQGGKTRAEMRIDKQGLHLTCQIKAQYQWPFCEIQIKFSARDANGRFLLDQGIDLSNYTQLYMDLAFQGEQADRVRLYIRNFNPLYSNLEKDENSFKLNEVEFSANEFNGGMLLPIKDFNVPSWWLHPRKLPIKQHGVELTNVPLISFASGSEVEEGEITLSIKQMYFRYNLISQQNILFFIIALWLSAAFITLFMMLKNYRLRLYASNKVQKKQKQILKTLKLEKSEMEQLAHRDPLTGLHNRAGISKYLIEYEDKAQKKGAAFSLIFIDIDFFKTINDQYGHNVGDDILVAFSLCIERNIREQDKLARWGGEEFILLSINTDITEAQYLAEKLRNLIAKQSFIKKIKVTASLGVAQMEIGETTDSFFERADNALYQAKSNGRNQVCVAIKP